MMSKKVARLALFLSVAIIIVLALSHFIIVEIHPAIHTLSLAVHAMTVAIVGVFQKPKKANFKKHIYYLYAIVGIFCTILAVIMLVF